MIPRNEMEVVVLFSQQAQAAGFEIVSVQAGFPDAVVKHGDTEYKVEFEYRSSNFWAHRHDATRCDLIICWINDDEYPILPIIALSDTDWPKTPIAPPPQQERLAGFWRARALASERKLEEVEKRNKESGSFVPEEVKAELDALLKEAMEKVGEASDAPELKNIRTVFVFGTLIEDAVKMKPQGIELLYFHRYARQLIELIFS